MATTDVTKASQLPSSLSPLGKGRVGLGLGVGGSGGLSMSADDYRLSQQVQEKHTPDGRHVDVRPLLNLVEDIFARANQSAHLDTSSKAAVKGNAGAGATVGVNGGVAGSAGAGATVGVNGGVAGNVGGGVRGGLGVGAGVGGGVDGQMGVGGGIGGNLGGGVGGNVGGAADGVNGGGIRANVGGEVGGANGGGIGANVGGGVGGAIEGGIGASVGGGVGGAIGGGIGASVGGVVGGEIGGGVRANVGAGVGGEIGGGIGANIGAGVGGANKGGIGANMGGGIGGGNGFNVGGGIGGGIGAGVEAGAVVKGGGKVGGSIGGIGGEGGFGVGGGIGGSLGVGGAARVGGGAMIGIDGGFDVKGDIATIFDDFPDLPLMIERVSYEMGCKGLGGANPHEATFSVLETLAHYSWEAKMVITLAAFAANYGEFLLLAQVYSTNPLAQSMALLKQLPSILHHASEKTKRPMEAIKGLINAMLSVTKLVVEFNELPTEYVKPDEPTVKVVHNHFPLVVYWTIRSALAAATHIALIATMGHEFIPSTTELDLFTWSGKLNFVFDFLKKMKISVQKIIDEKQEEEAYNKIRKIIFKMVHQDNMIVLRTLIYNKDDVLPLFDGSTKKRVQLDVLQGKTVLLLLTSLEISQDELIMLENIYNESKTRPYSIIWVPVVDRSVMWNDSLQSQFESTQSTMPWYSVYHPSIVGSAVIRFFRKDLSFKGKPILVPIDTQGKITSTNALHMMWIWKNDAFPFTNVREESLWMNETWRLEFLLDNVHPNALKWAKEDKYTFIYGGEDIDWIRKLTKIAKFDVATTAKINLEMVYVGKSCKRETVRKITNTIESEKLSDYLKDVTSTWYFWTRLESMLQSLIQLGKVNDNNNKVIQEIKKLVSRDKNARGWAILAKGSELVVSAQGTTILDVLGKFDEWKERVDKLGGAFHLALEEAIKANGLDTDFRFEFPTNAGVIPHEMKCPDCQNQMENYTTFVCSHEDGLSGGVKHELAKNIAALAT